MANLGKGFTWLSTTAAGAPMLGFLGTVVGMIEAFFALANAGTSANITVLSSGIYQALVTTVVGLIVGIAALFAYNFLVSRVNRIMNSMESKTMEFMDLLNEPSFNPPLNQPHHGSEKIFPDPRHVLDVVDDRRHIPAPHLLHGHLDAHLPGGNRRQPPQSSEQTSLKPVTEVYIDKDSKLFLVADRNDSTEENSTAGSHPRRTSRQPDAHPAAGLPACRGLYADSTVAYARVIEVLDLAARNNLRLVLATRSSQK